MNSNLLYGEISAILTALSWSVSIIMFRHLGKSFTPLNLTLWKGSLAILGLAVTLFFTRIPISPETNDILWLLLSGAIGIGIGDSAFFAALNRMSESTTLLLTETLAPIMTALLAMIWLAEWLTVWQWLAIAVILFGVDIVIRSRKRKRKIVAVTLSGFNFAALAALCQAIGAVIGRDVLVSSQLDAITASLIRLIGGVVTVAIFLIFSKDSWFPKANQNPHTWKMLIFATFFGTFLAMMFQTYAFANAPAAIVQSLFASSIIFSLIIAYLLGQKVSLRAFVGSGIALMGVGLIMFV
ncbi:MAG: DMT family transporter [Methylococcales bacterium]